MIDVVDWNLRSKLQWNPKQNSYIVIQENACENVVCETATILSRPQCVKYVLALRQEAFPEPAADWEINYGRN